VANLFNFDPNTGARGAVGVAGRTPGVRDDRLYVTSRVDPRVQTLIAVRPPPGTPGRLLPSLVPTESFFMSSGVNTSSNGRGIAFGAGPPDQDGQRAPGERAYILNRSPPMLHIFDTSLGEQGVPRNLFVGAVELCSQTSNLVVVPRTGGDGVPSDRVYVACFGGGQVWVIDPVGRSVNAIIDVGRGPQALVASPARNRLYVTNNLEDTIAVIDITPEAPTENRVVLRLGRPRTRGDR
jgi:YVTN family beta-propeller protein